MDLIVKIFIVVHLNNLCDTITKRYLRDENQDARGEYKLAIACWGQQSHQNQHSGELQQVAEQFEANVPDNGGSDCARETA